MTARPFATSTRSSSNSAATARARRLKPSSLLPLARDRSFVAVLRMLVADSFSSARLPLRVAEFHWLTVEFICCTLETQELARAALKAGADETLLVLLVLLGALDVAVLVTVLGVAVELLELLELVEELVVDGGVLLDALDELDEAVGAAEVGEDSSSEPPEQAVISRAEAAAMPARPARRRKGVVAVVLMVPSASGTAGAAIPADNHAPTTGSRQICDLIDRVATGRAGLPGPRCAQPSSVGASRPSTAL